MAIPDLHIITFAVPYPPTYGGAIDVWNRLKALSGLGVKINLHCFAYSSFVPQRELEEVAQEIHYYPRTFWPLFFPHGQPYIVASRKIPALLTALKKDDQPVFFEGIHTTAFMKELKGRTLLLRAHNVEFDYYSELAEQNKGLKSFLFGRESRFLKEYEQKKAKSFNAVFAISPDDHQWYLDQGANSVLLTPFHGNKEVDMLPGRGGYLLYQGDLSLEINQNAVLDLLKRLPQDQIYPIIVAGRSGNRAFEEKLKQVPNLKREADVTQEKMRELIQNAQVVLIHSFHASGMKLKLFPALFYGRFIAATFNCKTETGLDRAISFYETASLAPLLKQLWSEACTTEIMQQRTEIIAGHPGDVDKAKEIIKYI